MSPAESTPKSKSNSTGPRTPDGKRKASLNALRHGLTGRIVVLPSEDMDAYHAFCKELMTGLAPDGPLEKQYAQTFCDTQWRLNRARSWEDSLLSLGFSEEPGDIDPGHPQIHAAMTGARVYRQDPKAFVNLTLYEQRLQRALKESLRQLQELQAQRISARQAALDEAVALRNLDEMKGEPHHPEADPPAARFVFSTPITQGEIEAEARRKSRRADAEYASRCGYRLDTYLKDALKQAA